MKLYLLIIIFLSGCTTIEVTKEVVKVGNVVKQSSRLRKANREKRRLFIGHPGPTIRSNEEARQARMWWG